MTDGAYESYQMRLIAAEYEAKGYRVALEERILALQANFDAVARGPGGEVVIIEVVNRSRGSGNLEDRAEALRRAAAILPKASVDFRYIDAGQAAFFRRPSASAEGSAAKVDSASLLLSLLSTRLPKKPGKGMLSLARAFLDLWALHVATIAAFAHVAPVELGSMTGALDAYDRLLRVEALSPPEQLENPVSLDLYQLHDVAKGLLLAGAVAADEVEELREHVKSARRQIRRWITEHADAAATKLS